MGKYINTTAALICSAAALFMSSCSNDKIIHGTVISSPTAAPSEIIEFQGHSINIRDFASLIAFLEEMTFTRTNNEAAATILKNSKHYNSEVLYDLYMFYSSLTNKDAARLYAAVLKNL